MVVKSEHILILQQEFAFDKRLSPYHEHLRFLLSLPQTPAKLLQNADDHKIS